MAAIDPLLKKLPPETQDVFRMVWDALSPGEKSTLESMLSGLPVDTNLFRMLMRLSTVQLKQAFGQKQQVAIVGPTNVGKSTLYNQFVQRKEDTAAVSALPGTTRINQLADAGLFAIVDTPGADAVGEVGEREQQEALSAAQKADFLIIVFDAIQGVKQTELELFHQLTALKKPYVVVVNKVDLVRKESRVILEKAALSLGLSAEQVIPVVAKTGENLPQVVTAIAMTEPQIVAALGRGLPQYRWKLAWRSIVSAASIAAVIALTPLPIIDFAPLLITQSVMVLGIARIYNYKITLERARELIATFGLGLLGRTLFAELSKLGGLPGWVLAAAIASSMTVVTGYASVVWFERGERLSTDTLKKMTQATTEYFLGILKGLGKRKPGKQTLQEHIAEALEQSVYAEGRELFDEQAKDQSAKSDQ